MVVDDDPAVRRVTAEMLRAADHDVLDLGSGEEALSCLQQARPDVLVVDVAMPRMNGVELAAASRQHWPGLPVLFITGYAEERLLPPGSGEQILRKPFDADELEGRVAAVAGS
jgi:CheY-like chemotaxis protein